MALKTVIFGRLKLQKRKKIKIFCPEMAFLCIFSIFSLDKVLTLQYSCGEGA